MWAEYVVLIVPSGIETILIFPPIDAWLVLIVPSGIETEQQ